MCLAVYLASASPIPNVASLADTPTLNLKPLLDREAEVRAQFSHPNVYYVGSHTGCGCGFSAGDPANGEARAQTIADLVSLLREVHDEAPFEILVCWEGDERKPAKTRLIMSVAELVTRTDWTEERTFSTIKRAA